MKAITLNEVKAEKAKAIARFELNRRYAGESATDQRVEYVERMSDEEFMRQYNEVVSRENLKSEKRAEKKSTLTAERKATGKSKKAYRAEYDALMAEYKSTNNIDIYKQAKSIAKYAF